MSRYQLCFDKQHLEGTFADLVIPCIVNYPTEESAGRAFGAMRACAAAGNVLHDAATGRRFTVANVHLVDAGGV